jgi:transcriptional regulator with XRE-family HTH domain
MTLGQKLRYLRCVEGQQRGLARPLTQIELVDAMHRELGKHLSQSYLSQIENGVRPHLTHKTRTLLARFFKVHPGFLVDDPKNFPARLERDLDTTEGKLDVWLLKGAERFANDPEVSGALMRVASQKDTRKAVVLLGWILATPQLTEGLWSLVRRNPIDGAKTSRARLSKDRTSGARPRRPRR